nr:hypothetical protein [uncultured Agathobaculum sp.]
MDSYRMSLPGVDAGNVFYQFGPVRMELTGEQILVLVYLLSHLLLFPAPTNLGQQVISIAENPTAVLFPF